MAVPISVSAQQIEPASTPKPSALFSDEPSATRTTLLTVWRLVFAVMAGVVVLSAIRRFRAKQPESPESLPVPPEEVPETFLYRCCVCGQTDVSNPSLDFRVADDGNDYCSVHRPGSKRSGG